MRKITHRIPPAFLALLAFFKNTGAAARKSYQMSMIQDEFLFGHFLRLLMGKCLGMAWGTCCVCRLSSWMLNQNIFVCISAKSIQDGADYQRNCLLQTAEWRSFLWQNHRKWPHVFHASPTVWNRIWQCSCQSQRCRRETLSNLRYKSTSPKGGYWKSHKNPGDCQRMWHKVSSRGKGKRFLKTIMESIS